MRPSVLPFDSSLYSYASPQCIPPLGITTSHIPTLFHSSMLYTFLCYYPPTVYSHPRCTHLPNTAASPMYSISRYNHLPHPYPIPLQHAVHLSLLHRPGCTPLPSPLYPPAEYSPIPNVPSSLNCTPVKELFTSSLQSPLLFSSLHQCITLPYPFYCSLYSYASP